MTRPEQPSKPHLVGTVLALLCGLAMIATQPVQAQTFSVIHNFSGGQDGATPYAGLTMDKAGNLYGTAFSGGSSRLGTVYRLKRSGSSWVADGLYSFRGGANDAAQPLGRVLLGPDGSLYGTASVGGPGQFCGVGCSPCGPLCLESLGQYHYVQQLRNSRCDNSRWVIDTTPC